MALVYCGEGFSVCLGSLGVIWATGVNLNGQHGSGNFEPQYMFKEVSNFALVTQISCGLRHTICLDESGQVWAFGDNRRCQLGITALEGIKTRCIPEKVEIPAEITFISCGLNHTICLDSNMKCWSFGCNEFSQLGRITDRNTMWRETWLREEAAPNCIHATNDIRLISCSNHNIFVDYDGNLQMCGNNSNYQLGIPHPELPKNMLRTKDARVDVEVLGINDTVGYINDVKCTKTATMLLNDMGEVWIAGNVGNLYYNEFTHVESLIGIQQISSGSNFFMCTDNMGKFWTFGEFADDGRLGRLVDCDSAGIPGIIHEIENVVAMSQGGHHAFVLCNTGAVWAFGGNAAGQLGLGFSKCKGTVLPTKLSTKSAETIGGKRTRLKSARK